MTPRLPRSEILREIKADSRQDTTVYVAAKGRAQRSTAAAGLLLVSTQGLYTAAMQSSTTRSASSRVVVACTSPMHMIDLISLPRSIG
jgi:hypothetical protein